jgi:UPF0755 protein
VRRFLKYLFYIIMIGLMGFAALIYHDFSTTINTHPVVVVIPKGSTTRAIADILEKNTIINWTIPFLIYARLQSQTLKAGEYAIASLMPLSDVINMLTKGSVVSRKVVVIEGMTSVEVNHILQSANGLTGDIPIIHEGSVLPNTYSYEYGTKRRDVLNTMQEAQKLFMATIWPKRVQPTPIINIEQAIILASMVEKEAGSTAEMPVIASVFINRLRLNMKLQSDPTVIYALTNGKEKLGRVLTRKDWLIQSPYNTYLIDRLPPTPICNPSKNALMAVLNPISTSYLFFVAKGDGFHAFSSDYDQHKAEIAKWRQ